MLKSEESLKEKIVKKILEKNGPAIQAFNDSVAALEGLEGQRASLTAAIEKLKVEFTNTFENFSNIDEAKAALKLRARLQTEIDEKEKLLKYLGDDFIPKAQENKKIAAASIEILGIINDVQKEKQEEMNELTERIINIGENFSLECTEAIRHILGNEINEFMPIQTRAQWRMFKLDRLPIVPLSGYVDFLPR